MSYIFFITKKNLSLNFFLCHAMFLLENFLCSIFFLPKFVCTNFFLHQKSSLIFFFFFFPIFFVTHFVLCCKVVELHEAWSATNGATRSSFLVQNYPATCPAKVSYFSSSSVSLLCNFSNYIKMSFIHFKVPLS